MKPDVEKRVRELCDRYRELALDIYQDGDVCGRKRSPRAEQNAVVAELVALYPRPTADEVAAAENLHGRDGLTDQEHMDYECSGMDDDVETCVKAVLRLAGAAPTEGK